MDSDFLNKLEFLQMSTECRTSTSPSSQNSDPTPLCNKAQEAALQILGPERVTDAKAIDTLEKLLILTVFGSNFVEEAKRFPDQNQSSAIEIVGDYELAIKVNNPFQVEALKILGPDKEALKYSNQFQIYALRTLGKNFGNVAWKFDSQHKLDALKFLNYNYKLALEFDTREKVMALQIMGASNADLALKFTLYSQVNALMALEDNPKEALRFTKNLQTKALEIVGATNAELALQVKNHQQVTCLENCENNISEFVKCVGDTDKPLDL